MISITYQPTEDYDILSVPFANTLEGRTPQERLETENRLKTLQARKLSPHDGKELALMLAGQKPAALIHMTPSIFNEWKFWLGNQTMIMRDNPISERENRDIEDREVIVVLKTEIWRASSIEILLTKAIRRADISGTACKPFDAFLTIEEQKQLGKLLGYRDADLTAWENEKGISWTEEKTEENVSENEELKQEKPEGRFGRFLNNIIEDPMAPAAIRLFSAALSVAKDAVAKKKEAAASDKNQSS